jgi:hypothetical protein
LGGALGEGRFGKVTSHSAASLFRDRHAVTGTAAGADTGVGIGGEGVTGTGTGTGVGVANSSSPTPAPPPAPHVRSLRTSRRTEGKEGHKDANTRDTVCARYMGHIGGDWPTPQRGHWFPFPGDVDSFRQSLREACPPHAPQVGVRIIYNMPFNHNSLDTYANFFSPRTHIRLLFFFLNPFFLKPLFL